MPVSSESIGPEASPAEETSFDPHFEPIISLPEVNIATLEEDEIEMIKLRAKLFRYDSGGTPHEWKERGTGEVKLLHHKEKNTVRVVMRRDKTLKICANHFVTPSMELKPNCGSDRAWVWSVRADFADEVMCSELLAIRFANADNAKKWFNTFEEAKQIVAKHCDLYTKSLEELCNEGSGDESGNESSDGSDSLSEDDGSDDKVKETDTQKSIETAEKNSTELNKAIENLKIDSKVTDLESSDNNKSEEVSV